MAGERWRGLQGLTYAQDMNLPAGWYPYEQTPEGWVDYLRWWDGEKWTDRQAGWHPDPDDPKLMRYWSGDHWVRGMAVNLDQGAFMELLGPRDITADITADQAVAEIRYLDPKQRLYLNRKQVREFEMTKSAFLVGLPTIFLIFNFATWLVVAALVFLARYYLGIPVWVSLLLAVLGAIGFAAFRLAPTISASRSRKKEQAQSFLCSPTEAQALPEGALCTITGPAFGEGMKVFGRDDCLFYAQQATMGEIRTRGNDFYLGSAPNRIKVKAADLKLAHIGPVEAATEGANAWGILCGDEISVSGRIRTTTDGTREFDGECQLGFPTAAYSGRKKRINKSIEAGSSRTSENRWPGPAVVLVRNGYLLDLPEPSGDED